MKSLQIILMGWEYDRILYGIKQRPPNKVIFISSDPEKTPDKNWGQESTALSEKIGESIKSLIDYEIVFFKYHELDDCMEKTTLMLEKACKEYDNIEVNVSAGTTLLKMAFMLASQYYPIKLFYVIPAQYTHPCEIITTGARGLVELPSINLSKLALPKKKQGEIFLLIGKDKKSFTTITKEYAKQKEIRLNADKTRTLKSWLFYHLKKLEQQNLIETKIENKELFLSLTQTGKFIKLVLEHKKKENEQQTKLKIKKKNNINSYA